MTKKDRRRNMVLVFWVGSLAIFSATIIAPNVLSLLALKLGAGEVWLGLIQTVTLAPVIFSFLAMSAVERYGKRRILLFCHTAAMLCAIPFLWLPGYAQRAGDEASLFWLIVNLFLVRFFASMGFAGWFPILQDIAPPRLTGRFFANFRMTWQTVTLVLLLSIAWFLGRDPDWWKFQALFSLVLVTYVLRVFCLLPLTERPLTPDRSERSSMIQLIGEFWQQPGARKLLGYLLAYGLAFTLSEPFKIKLLKDQGCSDGFILAALAMVNLGAMLTLRLWGRLADRFGNRHIFSISHIGMIVVSLGWVLVVPNLFGSILAFVLYFIGSIFISGNGIAQTRYILHTVSPDKQSQITIANTMFVLACGVSPLLGAGLLKLMDGQVSLQLGLLPVDHYDLLFVIAALLFLLPHRLRKGLGLKKDIPTLHVVVFVLRPLVNLFGPFARFGNNRKSRDN